MKIKIEFRQTDPDAKADSSPVAIDKQPWSDLSIFKRDDFDPSTLPNVMTLEHNHTILDGTMDEFPENPFEHDWGLWTQSISDENGMFGGVPPSVDTVFGSVHKSAGLTFPFYPWSPDWAATVRVTWYDISLTNTIKSGVYSLTGNPGVIIEPVDGYRRIFTEFLSTNLPHRFVKLWNIEHGIIRTFQDEDIDAANLLEEIDPISDIVSINTFGFSTRTHSAEFSPISGNVADDMMMKRQNLKVTADNKPFGVFFLDTWKDKYNNGTVFDFQAMDAIGVMDGYRFMGDIYNNVLASDIIAQLFELVFPAQLVKFKLDDEFVNVRVTGHIPICTVRQALQYICFAIGAVADTSRRNYVWIYRRDTERTFTITRDKIYQGGANEPTQYFSGLDLTAYEFAPTAESHEVHNGYLPVGRHVFEFSEPLHTLSITGGAVIISKSANYAAINVTTSGNVALKGNRYTRNERTHSVRADVIAGQQGNICTFSGATLVDNAKAPTLTNDLWAYISQRISISNDVRLEDLEVGYIAEIATYQRPIVGTIESLDINLRGGRAKIRMVGNVEVT